MANRLVRRARKRNYTVIATLKDTGEVVASLQHATDGYAAMARQAAEMVGAGDQGDIVCAIRGDVDLLAACDESGATADIKDMAGVCECGRNPWECATFEDEEADHGDK